MAMQNSENQLDSKTEAEAGEIIRDLNGEKREEEEIGIFVPEQEPPAEVITPELRAEAAALEALNLRPRVHLPPHKRRDENHARVQPSPRLAGDFERHHKKILAAFSDSSENKGRMPDKKPSWTDRFKKLFDYPRRRRLKLEKQITHDQDLIMAYARQKKSITEADVRILLGADERRAAGLLAGLVEQNQLLRFGQEPDICYKPKTY